MRFAGNFHPEWGYLAPAPNFMRTARVVVVATAIGATAGAAVVLSLAERSAPGAMADAGKTLVVVHSLVQPAEAAAPATAPIAAAAPVPVVAPIVAAGAGRSGGARESASQHSTEHNGHRAGHAATERAARYSQCAADCAAARAERVARGVDFGGAGERCRAVGEPAGDRGFAAACEQRCGRFARSVGAAKGRDQKARRDRPAAAARPATGRRRRAEKEAGGARPRARAAPAVQRELNARSLAACDGAGDGSARPYTPALSHSTQTTTVCAHMLYAHGFLARANK